MSCDKCNKIIRLIQSKLEEVEKEEPEGYDEGWAESYKCIEGQV